MMTTPCPPAGLHRADVPGRGRARQARVVSGALSAALLLLAGTAAALDCAVPAAGCPIGEDCRWSSDGVLSIGYRPDAPPFSFNKQTSLPGLVRPAGYNVEICRQIAEDIAAKYHRDHADEGLSVQWVPVDAASRFTCLRNGHIDILCGTATVTLERMREFESSLFTFLTGASFMCKGLGNVSGDGIGKKLEGKTLAYVRGSTTLAVVDRIRLKHGIELGGVCPQGSYGEAIKSLLRGLDRSDCEDETATNDQSNAENRGAGLPAAEKDTGAAEGRAGQEPKQPSSEVAEEKAGDALAGGDTVAAPEPGMAVDCVFGDRDVLNSYYRGMPACEQGLVHLDRQYHSLEPYALFVRRGDDPDLLYEINRRLVELFREDPKSRNSIKSIFTDFFGTARMSDYLEKLFEVQRLPMGGTTPSESPGLDACLKPIHPGRDQAQGQASGQEQEQGQSTSEVNGAD